MRKRNDEKITDQMRKNTTFNCSFRLFQFFLFWYINENLIQIFGTRFTRNLKFFQKKEKFTKNFTGFAKFSCVSK